jgi:hypothetical protein
MQWAAHLNEFLVALKDFKWAKNRITARIRTIPKSRQSSAGRVESNRLPTAFRVFDLSGS